MNIKKVVVACFKKDMYLLRPCIASINYWYPDAEIYLLKDYKQGDFDTSEIEKYFNAKVFDTKMKYFGWPWSKLAILLKEEKDEFLFLDSDIVVLGKVLDKLNSIDADIIVTGRVESDKYSQGVSSHYFEVKEVEKNDPEYKYPGFVFNGGQIAMTSGLLKKKDFEPVISFEPEITNTQPDLFKHGDQGALNYLLAKADQNNKIKLKHADFWIWPASPKASDIDLDSIKRKEGIPYVLHWAGIKPVDYRRFKRYDIMSFYENEYYKHVPMGSIKKATRKYRMMIISQIKILSYKLRGLEYVK